MNNSLALSSSSAGLATVPARASGEMARMSAYPRRAAINGPIDALGGILVGGLGVAAGLGLTQNTWLRAGLIFVPAFVVGSVLWWFGFDSLAGTLVGVAAGATIVSPFMTAAVQKVTGLRALSPGTWERSMILGGGPQGFVVPAVPASQSTDAAAPGYTPPGLSANGQARLLAARTKGREAQQALSDLNQQIQFGSPDFLRGYPAGAANWDRDQAADAANPTVIASPASLNELIGSWYGYVNKGKIQGVAGAALYDPAQYVSGSPPANPAAPPPMNQLNAGNPRVPNRPATPPAVAQRPAPPMLIQVG